MRTLLVLILSAVLIAGCGGGQWTHPAKGPAELSRDMAECKMLARDIGRNKSHTGKRVELIAYQQALHSCLAQKGWTLADPGKAPEKPASGSQVLLTRSGEGVLNFDQDRIVLPQGVRISKQSVGAFGPVIMDTVDIEGRIGQMEYSGQLIAQKLVTKAKFESILYNLNEPYFTYSVGRTSGGLRWRSFAVKIGEEWYGGVGSYWPLSRDRRVVITLAATLPGQTGPPPSGCRLTPTQGEALDRFIVQVLPWFENFKVKKKFRDYFRWEQYYFIWGD